MLFLLLNIMFIEIWLTALEIIRSTKTTGYYVKINYLFILYIYDFPQIAVVNKISYVFIKAAHILR